MKLNNLAINWLKEQGACTEGFAWACKSCKTLKSVVTDARPDWSIWVFLRPGVLTDRELWLFACWCAEQALPNWDAFAPDDHRPRLAIEARRGWLEGTVTDEELSAAESAALSAARAAARAAESAAESAADLAAYSAKSAAESAQKDWLLANTNPTFVDNV